MDARNAPLKTLSLALALGCGVAGCDRDRDAASPDPATLEYGARVRVRVASDRLPAGWNPAVVGTVGACRNVMLSTNEAVPSFTPVPFEIITALEVSDRYPGGTEPHIYYPGSDTTGEGWTALPVDALRERYGGCVPF